MRTILRILILLLFCTLFGLWSPWFNWNINFSRLFGVEKVEQISGLKVLSLSGDIDIFIDNELVDSVDSENSFTTSIVALEPGEKTIRLERKSEVENAFWSFNKVINFEEGLDVVISYRLGTSEEISEGHIITASEKKSETYNLFIKTNVQDPTILINNIPSVVEGNTLTQNISLDNQHVIKITKAGFEDIEFLLLPETQEERDKFKNYVINVDAHLMYQPLQIE
jgi:hypothetical protein